MEDLEDPSLAVLDPSLGDLGLDQGPFWDPDHLDLDLLDLDQLELDLLELDLSELDQLELDLLDPDHSGLDLWLEDLVPSSGGLDPSPVDQSLVDLDRSEAQSLLDQDPSLLVQFSQAQVQLQLGL